jgi:hypothetical protein
LTADVGLLPDELDQLLRGLAGFPQHRSDPAFLDRLAENGETFRRAEGGQATHGGPDGEGGFERGDLRHAGSRSCGLAQPEHVEQGERGVDDGLE